jgi:hypothetical protein
MAQENPKTPISNVKITLDRTEIEKDKDAKILELSTELGKMQEANKTLLAQHKTEFEAQTKDGLKIAPKDGETATYDVHEPEEYKLSNLDLENSDIPLSWVKGKTEAEVIEIAEHLARHGNPEYVRVIQKLTKKLLHGDKPLDMTFKGSSKDFMRNELKVRETDTKEIRNIKEQVNSKLKANRCNWSIGDD